MQLRHVYFMLLADSHKNYYEYIMRWEKTQKRGTCFFIKLKWLSRLKYSEWSCCSNQSQTNG